MINFGPNLAVCIPERKATFENYIYYDGLCPSTINPADLELQKAYESLKTNKNLRYDDVSTNVVKKVSHEIFIILKHIFLISLAKGIFSDKNNSGNTSL